MPMKNVTSNNIAFCIPFLLVSQSGGWTGRQTGLGKISRGKNNNGAPVHSLTVKFTLLLCVVLLVGLTLLKWNTDRPTKMKTRQTEWARHTTEYKMCLAEVRGIFLLNHATSHVQIVRAFQLAPYECLVDFHISNHFLLYCVGVNQLTLP